MKRRIPEKNDFLRYIQDELCLEFSRRARLATRNKHLTATSMTPKPPSLSDFAIVRHIHAIFKRALRKYSGDISLWLSFIEFAQKFQSYKTLARIFAQALRQHPLQEGFWILAVSYEFNYHGNVVAARTLFQRALRLLPESPLLWSQYFLFELSVSMAVKDSLAGMVAKHDSEMPPQDNVLATGVIPKVVLDNAIIGLKAVPLCKWLPLFLDAYKVTGADFDVIKPVLASLASELCETLSVSCSLKDDPMDQLQTAIGACRSEAELLGLKDRFLCLYEENKALHANRSLMLYECFVKAYMQFKALDVVYNSLSTRIITTKPIVELYLKVLADLAIQPSHSLASLREKLLSQLVHFDPALHSPWLMLIDFYHVRGNFQKVTLLYHKAMQAVTNPSQFTLSYHKLVQ